jgi:hypothetical protein
MILQSTPAIQSRRAWISQQITLVGRGASTSAVFITTAEPSHASEELPSFLKDYTKLAPLGSKESKSMVDRRPDCR